MYLRAEEREREREGHMTSSLSLTLPLSIQLCLAPVRALKIGEDKPRFPNDCRAPCVVGPTSRDGSTWVQKAPPQRGGARRYGTGYVLHDGTQHISALIKNESMCVTSTSERDHGRVLWQPVLIITHP